MGMYLLHQWVEVEKLQGGCIHISGVLGLLLRRGGQVDAQRPAGHFIHEREQKEVTPWGNRAEACS